MILVSDKDFKDIQNSLIDDFNSSLDIIESSSFLNADEYDLPRLYITKVLSVALIGEYKYVHIGSYISDIMLDFKKLDFFKKVHTKQEIRDFINSIN